MSKKTEDKVICKTPTPGKKHTRIDRWKYDLVRKAILKAVPSKGDGLPFKELAKKVAAQLTSHEKKRLGSVGWYTTTVKLDMEVQGELERVDNKKVQQLLRTI
jgi:hypothetical protein